MSAFTRVCVGAIICYLAVTSTSAGQSLPTVAVLSTGGTIASRTDPTKGGYVPALSADDLIAAVPAIKKVAQIEAQQIANISSSDMTPKVWLDLSMRINDVLSRADIAGAVVTHGTNTLEETAYFLDLTVTSSKPVVLVGAQRPASDPDADGPRNLLDAIRVATSPEATGNGVMVVMNGQINAARDVTKTNTSQVETFRSLESATNVSIRGVPSMSPAHGMRTCLCPIGTCATVRSGRWRTLHWWRWWFGTMTPLSVSSSISCSSS